MVIISITVNWKVLTASNFCNFVWLYKQVCLHTIIVENWLEFKIKNYVIIMIMNAKCNKQQTTDYWVTCKRTSRNRSLSIIYLFKARFPQLFMSLISCAALCLVRDRVMPPPAPKFIAWRDSKSPARKHIPWVLSHQ